MTREEAIAEIERLLDCAKKLQGPQTFVDFRPVPALEMALAALRPVSREQVEKVWGGCGWCDEEWGTCDPITNRFTMPPRGGIRFCPMCGKPLTDEAVDMVMEGLEELKNANEKEANQ